jgi:hypothetical protein
MGWVKRFYDMLSRMEVTMATPTMSNSLCFSIIYDKTCKVCGYEVKGEKIPATGTTTPTEPTKPTNLGDGNPTNSVNPHGDKPTNPNGDGNLNTNSSQTDHNSNLWLWFVVLFIAGGILIGTSVYSKEKKYPK